MRRVRVPPDFAAWRTAARDALLQGFRPEEIDFEDETVERSLMLPLHEEALPTTAPLASPHVPAAFLKLSTVAAVHRDAGRWNLLYRLLFRLQAEHGLLQIEVDDDVATLHRLVDNVRRDLHKMHAFVRFRKIEQDDGEHFVAWYKPDHRILRMAAPFFAERFGIMRWTILTPDESVHWDPTARELVYTVGTGPEVAPAEDEIEDLWKSYYGSIFNPARLNPQAMRSGMPVRYWSNLPEVDLLPKLLQDAQGRVSDMVTQQRNKPSAAPWVPERHELPQIRRALPKCEGCELYKFATQVVPGAGPEDARLMLVGEQPGDQEDLQGEPFIGPAGRMLRKAMEEVGVKPGEVYMTNAVKHFKFVERGKTRLHQNPRMIEIGACKPWLLAELDAVQPRVVLCLGASAAKSLMGGTFALMSSRGQVIESPFAQRVIATVHPSAVLRGRDQAAREQLYGFLRDDLAKAFKLSRQ